ncbi:MAG TPA: hypothetical protein DER09_08615 [Prolixibacteraceae bacterium]|nr:hypothetical protein [Prolixibacteraceae bacterium]
MKKTIFYVIVLVFTMSSTFAFANKANKNSNSAVPVATENRLSEVEISRLTNRVEEIRNLDKTDMTLKEKSELKKELRSIKKNVEKNGGTVYIGGAALILIILLIILLV